MNSALRPLSSTPSAPLNAWAWMWAGAFLTLSSFTVWWRFTLAPCPASPVPLSSGVVVVNKEGEQISRVLTPHDAADERDRWNHNGYHANPEWLPAETTSVVITRAAALQHPKPKT